MDKYSTQDLIQNIITAKPVEAGDAFNSLMLDRLQKAIADKKIEIAQRIYAPKDLEDEINGETSD